jgi:hypothetical protein
VKLILTAGIEPGEDTTHDEFDKWYREEVNPAASINNVFIG